MAINARKAAVYVVAVPAKWSNHWLVVEERAAQINQLLAFRRKRPQTEVAMRNGKKSAA